MKVKWVFEKDAYQDGTTEKMIDICKQHNWLWQKVDYLVFDSDDHIKWDFHEDDCVIVYGSFGLIKHVQRKKKWCPGVWCDWDKIKCSTYMAYFGEYSLQDHYAFLPLAVIHRCWDKLFETYGSNGHVFLRPDSNDKSFNGEKVAIEYKEQWYQEALQYAEPTSLAMVSRPAKKLIAEWRFIVSDRKIVTGSMYRADGKTIMSEIDPVWTFDKQAIEFVDKVITAVEWQPEPIFAIDVCLVDGGEFKVVEIGSLNCCGLYKCNIPAIIEKANELALLEYRETHSEI
jgi:hypothetical protein